MNIMSRQLHYRREFTPFCAPSTGHNTQGFSLLELLFVLALSAILAVSGSRSFSHIIQTRQLRQSVEHIYYSLLFAQQRAYSEGKSYWVNIHTQNNWCITVSEQQDCYCTDLVCQVNPSRIAISRDQYPDVTLVSRQFNQRNQIQFNPSSEAAQGYAGTLVLAGAGVQLRVIVSHLGRVRICALPNTMWEYPKCG